MIERIEINLQKQTLHAYVHGMAMPRNYPISSARNGPGEQMGSYCTPRGLHRVRAKIGCGAPVGAVFVGRRLTGEIYSPKLGKKYPHRDWILTRILWLCGCQPGFNRLGDCDTMRRYIYIHGAPDEDSFAFPSSHGCIKMRNQELIEVFDHLLLGTLVNISA